MAEHHFTYATGIKPRELIPQRIEHFSGWQEDQPVLAIPPVFTDPGADARALSTALADGLAAIRAGAVK